MNPSEYEEYVAELVRQLEFCRNAKISRNRKFQGKRQPGQYEIDIAVEITFSEAIYFLMLIECKYWTRVVDRPVVQKLAQTRDAIAAHKAVIVSPAGFSSEAVDVARALGIALWVLCPGRVVNKINLCVDVTISHARDLFDDLRVGFLKAIDITAPAPIEDIRLRDFKYVEKVSRVEMFFSSPDKRGRLCDRFRENLAVILEPFWGRYNPLEVYDPILKELFVQITNFPQWHENKGLKCIKDWVNQSEQRLIEFGLPEQQIMPALTSIAANEEDEFLHLLDKYHLLVRDMGRA